MSFREKIRNFNDNVYKRQHKFFLLDVLLHGINIGVILQGILGLIIELFERKKDGT